MVHVTLLPVRLGVLGQVREGGVQVHQAGGLVHHPAGRQPARPAEDTGYPDAPFPPPHGLTPCRRGGGGLDDDIPPTIHRLYREMLTCYGDVLTVDGCQ